MRFEELDETTRRWMLEEFRDEESTLPYRSPALSAIGQGRFPALMEEAIRAGDEGSLAESLTDPSLWSRYEPAPQGGVRPVMPERAAIVLARVEFNTWYVRGLCRRLLEEGEGLCQVYRAWDGDGSPDECDTLENRVLGVEHVYRGHRAKYHPSLRPEAFSIPSGPGCKHSIRRLPEDMKAMLELESRQFGGAFRKR